MQPEAPKEVEEFVWQRLLEPLADITILLPVLFAFGVLGLIVWFRREDRWTFLMYGSMVVGGASLIYAVLALQFMPGDTSKPGEGAWWVILAPVLGVALAYVGLMYYRDSQSVNPAWAILLGVSRCLVYAILIWVFLLPGRQFYETSETHSKILILFDVSDSMLTVDDIAAVGQDQSTLLSRQDKILKFLTAKAADKDSFLERILASSPVEIYRFGKVLDEANAKKYPRGKIWAEDEWRRPDGTLFNEWTDFLKPDPKKVKIDDNLDDQEKKQRQKLRDLIEDLKTGTNVGGAALQLARLEGGSYLQAIIIVSDGQSNVGSEESIREFLGRVGSAKNPPHVFTIGVGDYRQPVSIRVDPLGAPEWARPDDKFLVKVPVVGAGLVDQEFDCTLEMSKIIKVGDKENVVDRKVLPVKKGKFKGAGDFPKDEVDFEIDLGTLLNINPEKDEKGLLEGIWRFVAKVPRAQGEVFPKKEHVSAPVDVLVQKRKLRVLLFAGGPSREYQFLRTLFYREVLAKRTEMALYLQTGREENVDQDVDPEWFLKYFPDTLKPNPAEKHHTLADYDVIVAVDPDWTALPPENLKLIKDWVSNHSGGVIFVAGPVHTFHLPRPGGLDLSPITTIFPVVLKDSRLHGLGIGHDPSRPYYLDFTKAARNFEFLKLDEAGDSPIEGWDRFFWGEGKNPEPGKDAKPVRGFFNYYPVEKLRPASEVIANFLGPQSSRINDGKDPQPFIVRLPVGNGKTLYIGSSETWRLRHYKETFHERFWIKLSRFMAAGTSQQKSYGYIPLPGSIPVGTLNFEARLKGEDLQFLPRDTLPTVKVKPPKDAAELKEFTLKAKATQGDWNGWFQGTYKIKTPGDYEFTIPIPGTKDGSVGKKLTVKKPNPEKDNLKNNFTTLYRLATNAQPVLKRSRDLEKALLASAAKVEDRDTEGQRLFLEVQYADLVPDCLTALEPKKQQTKGRTIDLWDKGFWAKGDSPDFFHVHSWMLLIFAPIVIGLAGMGILLFMKRYIEAAIFIGAGLVLALIMLVLGDLDWDVMEVNVSWIMLVVIGLLSMEWLARKLLKLA